MEIEEKRGVKAVAMHSKYNAYVIDIEVFHKVAIGREIDQGR